MEGAGDLRTRCSSRMTFLFISMVFDFDSETKTSTSYRQHHFNDTAVVSLCSSKPFDRRAANGKCYCYGQT